MQNIHNIRLHDGYIYTITVEGDRISKMTKQSSTLQGTKELFLIPPLMDMHVHSRDPGFTYKEDFSTLCKAALKGGVTRLIDMPNTNPLTESVESVKQKLELSANKMVDVGVFLGVSSNNVKNLKMILSNPELKISGLKIYTSGSSANSIFDNLSVLQEYLPDNFDKVIVFHAEDQTLIDENRLKFSSKYAANDYSVHSKIHDEEVVLESVTNILLWARNYKGSIHIAHVSTPKEIELINEAKSQGVNVTCEVCPHHLIFSTDDYDRLKGYAKVNPALRNIETVIELRKLVVQGCVDVFATDHAPHTKEEKSRPYKECPSGIPSVEFFAPLLFKIMELTGMTLDLALKMACDNPSAILKEQQRSSVIKEQDEATFTLLDMTPTVITSSDILSKCGWTPYEGLQVPCSVKETWSKGQKVYCA